MKNKKLRIIAYLIPLLVLAVTACLYPRLPEQIPTNWSVDGTVTYSEKHEIWLIAGMGILFAVLFDILPKIDPRKENYKKFGSYYDGFCIAMQLFMAAMSALILLASFHPGKIAVSHIVAVLVGVLLMGLGNIMPEIKSNFYMGIKTPWTLSDDQIWHRTHRLGGRLFVAAGAVMVLSVLFLPLKPAFFLSMVCILAAALIPGVMSYFWWKKANPKKS